MNVMIREWCHYLASDVIDIHRERESCVEGIDIMDG